jgi:hypothetical protein
MPVTGLTLTNKSIYVSVGIYFIPHLKRASLKEQWNQSKIELNALMIIILV